MAKSYAFFESETISASKTDYFLVVPYPRAESLGHDLRFNLSKDFHFLFGFTLSSLINKNYIYRF